METTGRRRKRERSYVTIENSMFEDNRISWKAKGILGYLLTKPDGWKVKTHDLIKHGTDKEKSLRAGIKELRENGYLYFYRTKSSDGKFSGIIWEYDDVPFFDPNEEIQPEKEDEPHADFRHVEPQEPHADFGHVENARVENGTCISNTNVSNLLTKKDLLVSLVSKADMNKIDSVLKTVFKNDQVPFDQIKEQVLADALNGDLVIKTQNQYQGIMSSRITDYIRSKKNQKAHSRPKRVTRTELLPDWFKEPDEPNQKPERDPKEDLEAKKREIAEMLKRIDE